MKNLFLVLAFLCLQTLAYSQTHSKQLPDGFYLVAEKIGDTLTANKIKDASTVMVRFNSLFAENAPERTEALLIYTNNFVPLELSKEPTLANQSEGKKKLELSFSQLAADKLASFTSKNLNKEATLIVNGEALTVNKIRAAITGGKMEITRCSDDACEKIMVQLKKNVK